MRDTTRRQDTPQNICVLVDADAKENLLLVHNEAMGLIHTPRTIFSIAKGLSKRQWFYSSNGKKKIPFDPLMRDPKTVAIGLNNHHVYQARLGLFDVDYLGHMNNGTFYWLECVVICLSFGFYPQYLFIALLRSCLLDACGICPLGID